MLKEGGKIRNICVYFVIYLYVYTLKLISYTVILRLEFIFALICRLLCIAEIIFLPAS